MLARLMVGL